MKDTQSNEPETFVELAKSKLIFSRLRFYLFILLFFVAGGPTKEEDDLPEPSPPEPFQYQD